uniref:Uncharacterized protein n=1 Tax=Mesocestoides corti TaxID=53468 RepID=A0A5K3G166_MESCO
MEARERSTHARHSSRKLACTPMDILRRMAKLCDARMQSNVRTSTELESMATELTDDRLTSAT